MESEETAAPIAEEGGAILQNGVWYIIPTTAMLLAEFSDVDFKEMSMESLEAVLNAALLHFDVDSQSFGPAEPAFLGAVLKMLRDMLGDREDLSSVEAYVGKDFKNGSKPLRPFGRKLALLSVHRIRTPSRNTRRSMTVTAPLRPDHQYHVAGTAVVDLVMQLVHQEPNVVAWFGSKDKSKSSQKLAEQSAALSQLEVGRADALEKLRNLLELIKVVDKDEQGADKIIGLVQSHLEELVPGLEHNSSDKAVANTQAIKAIAGAFGRTLGSGGIRAQQTEPQTRWAG